MVKLTAMPLIIYLFVYKPAAQQLYNYENALHASQLIYLA